MFRIKWLFFTKVWSKFRSNYWWKVKWKKNFFFQNVRLFVTVYISFFKYLIFCKILHFLTKFLVFFFLTFFIFCWAVLKKNSFSHKASRFCLQNWSKNFVTQTFHQLFSQHCYPKFSENKSDPTYGKTRRDFPRLYRDVVLILLIFRSSFSDILVKFHIPSKLSITQSPRP